MSKFRIQTYFEDKFGKLVSFLMQMLAFGAWGAARQTFLRLTSVFSGLFSVGKWFNEVCMWKNPITTVLVHVLFVMLVCLPELILPTVFLYMFLIGLWNFRFRPRYPPHMNTSLSCADAVTPDELDEEFETFPATKSSDLVLMPDILLDSYMWLSSN